MSHNFHPTSLREYDIRGIIDETLGAEVYYAIGGEPPDEAQQTLDLWGIVDTEDPQIEQQNLAAAWQEVQRSMRAPTLPIR